MVKFSCVKVRRGKETEQERDIEKGGGALSQVRVTNFREGVFGTLY